MKNIKKTVLTASLLFYGSLLYAEKEHVVHLKATNGDATPSLQQAIEKAAQWKGKKVTIKLENGDYNLYRTSASHQVYYVSNTASAEENPDPTKHIGLWLKKLRNVTIDGNGARLITHGEMTTFVIDSCENIVMKNFTLTAADPSVPEMTVIDTGMDYITSRIHPSSNYEINEETFNWTGEGWQFGGGLAQVFYPETNVTNRCESPMSGIVKAEEMGNGIVRFHYGKTHPFHKGEVYQMRHTIRNEVCGLIQRSKNVRLEDLQIYFLGNFGIVGQYSENLTYRHLWCAPEPGSGRTCAGFADFVQMSGCKGYIRIEDSYFEGAHDDAINVHGTHLKVTEYIGGNRIRVRFMHGQSYGFEAFAKGDKVELVDAHTLLCVLAATVRQTEFVDRYESILTLDKDISAEVSGRDNIVVENVTWTPDVHIKGNYFSRLPTRGILVTTRGKVCIEDNTFYRLPMPAILISDDARSWYESGPARNVTICHNRFIEGGSPAIAIMPENDLYEGAVHKNILIRSNRFNITSGHIVEARSSDHITVTDNVVETSSDGECADYMSFERCNDVEIKNNRLTHRK
ncbi:MAG: right-handed parallel beta-helix repeat-containing protein [Bacteroides sp.]|nr:right-handed parallel beta-helix repeat-containing protein [Roseburia sp.]MCM1345628.1 right-handed parallel beta-helix repeat-containing protein [Bacteroides sp.]MCM1420932.1 right-handed parallel beta-helix repeat-containing protein [Bacteroides sp.]